MKKRFSQKLLG